MTMPPTSVMGAVDVALRLGSAAVLVPSAFLLIEVVASRWGYRAAAAPPLDPTLPAPRIAVLVPAHDEAANIAATVTHLRTQLGAGDRLLVVADNCSDTTADLALAAGAEVAVRHDSDRRGKGYALDHGLAVLEREPPDVVLIVDADCRLSDGSAQLLARAAWQWERPVQACNLILPHDLAAVGQRVAAFAWRIKNRVRPLGCAALGIPCLLNGTGMALRWRDLQGVHLASGNIVEDMQLGLDLARRGNHPRYCVDALVTSHLAPRAEARASQRRRWEHGHLATLVRGVPSLIASAIVRRDAPLLGLALELSVPPLALLLLLVAAMAAVGAAAWLLGLSAWPLGLAGTALACIGSAVALAWRSDGRDLLSARELVQLPSYVLSKLPLYAAMLWRRESRWIRTDRDEPR